MHLTDTMGVTAGRTAIAREAAATTDFYLKAGVASHGASFVSVDKYGLDAAAGNGAAANPQTSTWFWNETLWVNYLTFAQAMGTESKLPVVLWQIPVGHINESTLANPQGGVFPDLTNVSTRYEDSAPDFFFGDTFNPGSAASNRASYISASDPLGNVRGQSGLITWPSAMSLTASYGIRSILFGAGVGDSTQGTGNPPTDSGWWITAAQNYYVQGPVPLTAAGTPTPTPTPTATPTPSPSAIPTVRVAATIPTVTVGSGGSGEFTLTVSLARSSEVLINLALKGTAINGTDYILLKTTKKFKAGQTAKAVHVTPIGDLAGASKKTVKLILTPGSGYTVGTATPVKVTLVARP